jgi:hypothetical protein
LPACTVLDSSSMKVKLQFAGASDFAVRRPNGLAVDYESELGAKRLWYNGKTLTIFDAPSMTYASRPVPPRSTRCSIGSVEPETPYNH